MCMFVPSPPELGVVRPLTPWLDRWKEHSTPGGTDYLRPALRWAHEYGSGRGFGIWEVEGEQMRDPINFYEALR